MKKYFVLLWLLFPVFVMAYHWGPGQRHLESMSVGETVDGIRALEDERRWQEAIDAYEQVKAELPTEEQQLVCDQIALSQLRATIELGQLMEAIEGLDSLLASTVQNHGPNAQITREVREQLGRVHYLTTIALRITGEEEDVWRRHVDLGRQHYRYLVENYQAGPEGLPYESHQSGDPSGGDGDIQQVHSAEKSGDIDERNLFNLHALLWAAIVEKEELESSASASASAYAAAAAAAASSSSSSSSSSSAAASSSSSESDSQSRQALSQAAADRSGGS